MEDQQSSSNIDPYIMTSLLAETTLLWESTLKAEAPAAQKLFVIVDSIEDSAQNSLGIQQSIHLLLCLDP